MTIGPFDAASSNCHFFQFNGDVPIKHLTQPSSRASMRFYLCYEEDGKPVSSSLNSQNEVLHTFKKNNEKTIAAARSMSKDVMQFRRDQKLAPFISDSLKEPPVQFMATNHSNDPTIRTLFSRINLSTITQLIGNTEWDHLGEATGLKVKEIGIEFFAAKTSEYRNREKAIVLGDNENIVVVPIFSKSKTPTTQIFNLN